MRPIERRAGWTAAAVFAASFAFGVSIVAHFQRLDVAERRRTATELASGSAMAIEERFSSTFAMASALAAMVREGATDAQLEGVANRLLTLAGGRLSLQLAKDGVISHVWPLKGNEQALGLRLIDHPVHGPFLMRLFETRQPLVYGPFTLVQGGEGLALRVPVLVRAGNGDRVWGVASAILWLRSLLDESRISGLVEGGYDWTLVRLGAGGTDERLATSRRDGGALRDPVSAPVRVPGQAWRLDIAPSRGWGGSPLPLALPPIFALLLALLAYRLVELPTLLRREVAARTRELEEAHTREMQAQAAQRQSQKLESIGLLAGGVAHDFNNLLVGILGYADVLRAEAAPGSLSEEAARTIVQASQRAAELTRQLLALARLGPVKSEIVDLHRLVQDEVALLRRTLDKSIRLETRLAAPRHHVRGDAGQLGQVLLNLVVNGRDAMPQGGTLRVETEAVIFDGQGAPPGVAAGSYVSLSVADTGVGIPPENLERIFEPFFTTKGEGKGSGLGLATAFGIARAHRGGMRVQSTLGEGSRFIVYLPVVEGEEAHPAAVHAAPRGAGTVLVVDDEELVRKTTGRLLQSLGYQPVLVSGGREALDWLQRQAEPPFAVLLDLSMPGMDGRACFHDMRRRVPGLRVVVSSGFSRDSRGDDLLSEGAVAFVQKPFTVAELAWALTADRGEEPDQGGRGTAP